MRGPGTSRLRIGGAAAVVALLVGVAAPYAVESLGLRAALAGGGAGTCTQTKDTVGACSTTTSEAGSLTGTVTDGAGTGLSGICVHIYPGGGNLTNDNDATTDGEGQWTIGDLPAGSYDVEFSAGCGNEADLVSVWYGGGGAGAVDEAASTPVAVTVGQFTSGVDVKMSTAGGKITGTVTDPSSAGAPGVCVYAYYPGGAARFATPVASATTGADGGYTLSGLSTGTYVVGFDPSCQNTVATPYATGYFSNSGVTANAADATPVTVTAGTITADINGQLADGPQSSYGTGSISGTVTGLVATAPICVDAFVAGTSLLASNAYDVSSTSDTYTLPHLVNGSYDIEFNSFCNGQSKYSLQWYSSSSSGGASTESASSPVDVTSSGDEVTGIDTTVSTASGTVKGTVADTEDPTGVGGVCADIYPAALVGGTGGYETAVSTFGTHLGSYSTTVPDGSYEVEFTDQCGDSNNDAYQWYTGSTGGTTAKADAGTVTVTTDSTVTADAKLTEGGSIAGTVTVPTPGAGFTGSASVSVYPTGSTTPVATTYVPSGPTKFAYTVGGLPSGRYDVEFTARKLNATFEFFSASEWYAASTTPPAAPHQSGASAVKVTTGKATSPIDASFGDISGTVTDPAGDPETVGVSLHLKGTTSDQFGTTSDQFGTTSTHFATVAPTGTPPSGPYDFGLVAEGQYDVSFTNFGTPGNLVNQWYNDKSTRSKATTLTIDSATPKTGIDATMKTSTAQVGSITGDVTGAGGSQAYAICVDVYPAASSPSEAVATSESYPDGTATDYSVSDLPAGTYKIEFDPTCSGEFDPGYPVQYYDADAVNDTTTSSADATAVTIAGGTTKGDINDRLPTLTPLSESSTVVMATPTGGDASPPTYGQPITYSATVTGTGGVPTGTVTFTAGTTTLCTTGDLALKSGDTATASCPATNTPVGSGERVKGSYQGSLSFMASSGTATVTVVRDPTSVTLKASTQNPAVGQQVTYTATVAPVPDGGAVTFDDSGSAITCTGGDQTVNTGNGTATCEVTYGSSGHHPITGTYGGDTDYAPSGSSNTVTVDVVSATSTTSVEATPATGDSNPPTYGQPITYTATVTGTGGVPTGTVTFTAGTTTLCSTGDLMVKSGDTVTASCRAINTPVGSDEPVTGTYSGSDTFGASHGTAFVTVDRAPTEVTLAASTTTPVVGQPVTYTATVAPIPDGGTVSFDDGTSEITCSNSGGQTVDMSTGQATCDVTYGSVPSTPHSITATYGGDPDYAPSPPSPPLSVTVARASTSIELGASTTSAVVGQEITYTATVSVDSPGSGSPTGSVTFHDGLSTITCTGGDQTLSGGKATCEVAYDSTTGSPHSITATFEGDDDFTGSGPSTAVGVEVSRASTAIALQASSNAPALGELVTYTATVSVDSPGSGSPTGSVTFHDGLSTIACTGGDQTLSGGKATCEVAYDSTTGSPHSITAAFAGDTDFAASPVSNTETVTVAKAATTTSASTNVVTSTDYGDTVSYRATVDGPSSPPGLPAPTGQVTFTTGSTTLCTTPSLTAGSGNTATGSCHASDAPPGEDTVTAKYSGDANYDTSTGTTSVTVDVAPPPAPTGSTSWASGSSIQPSGSATATAGDVSANGSGVGSLTVATYGANPTTAQVSDGTGAYYDVALGTGSSFSSVTITICHPNTGKSLYWWNGSSWAPFSNQSMSGGCLVAVVTATTSPTLAELTGTAIAVSGSPAPGAATGYDLVGSDGGVFVFNPPGVHTVGFYGSLPSIGVVPNQPVVGMVPTKDDDGYFLVAADGGVFSFGNAPFLGSLPGIPVAPNKPIVGIEAANTDRGYFLVGADGGVYSFGTVPFLGSLPGKGESVANVIGIAATPSGSGYWVVQATGTVTAFGTAKSFATTPTTSPVTAIAGTPTGGGYWLVTREGGVYPYGNAVKKGKGTLPQISVTPSLPVIGIVPTAATTGYWLLGQDGGIFAFGTAPYYGSLPGLTVSVANIVGAVPN